MTSVPSDHKFSSAAVDGLPVDVSALDADQRQYVEEHALRKPLRTPQIWALGAGTDYAKTGDAANLFPLPFVYREVWPDTHHAPHVIPFSVLALCGMAASYNGMVFAVSRQSFSLGRASYLPSFLGHVHPVRRTPDASIAFWSLVTAGFVLWGFYNEAAVVVAQGFRFVPFDADNSDVSRLPSVQRAMIQARKVNPA